MSEYKDRVSAVLMDRWQALRNDAAHYDRAVHCIHFAHDAGLLTDLEEKLWLSSLATCPGHADEGGRTWCNYCGDLRGSYASRGE